LTRRAALRACPVKYTDMSSDILGSPARRAARSPGRARSAQDRPCARVLVVVLVLHRSSRAHQGVGFSSHHGLAAAGAFPGTALFGRSRHLPDLACRGAAAAPARRSRRRRLRRGVDMSRPPFGTKCGTRDGGPCAFVGSTGERCTSRHQLELHHVHEAEQDFGQDVQRYRRSSASGRGAGATPLTRLDRFRTNNHRPAAGAGRRDAIASDRLVDQARDLRTSECRRALQVNPARLGAGPPQ
jgi:hypothetical protein